MCRLATRLAPILLLLPAMAPVGANTDAVPSATDVKDWLDSVPAPQITGLQFTLIRQHLYPLDSPYSSRLSLPADGSTSSTYTYGVYLGWEPIKHLQVYLDIEQFQGAGIANATGLASLTDGDSIRSGSSGLSKAPYLARKYVRYVLPVGEGTHAVERSQDTLPGDEADRHFEFKLGTMAVSDDFDKNRYANSTRTQFENWSLFNNTAWDFAADTRGYTSGGMAAYVTPGWALRYGIYQMPKHANGQALDTPITHSNGQQLELTLQQSGDDPAIVRLLVYENTARMGVYEDAIAQAHGSGQPPDITADDKPYRRKYGVTLNGELPLADGGESGLFTRLGWNNGRTESFAYTEVDRHVSVGGQLDGVHWWRQDDRLGIAYVVANLSGAHTAYLAAGGQGFVVGDGQIDYGAERVLETYYRFQPIRHVQLTADYQHIDHPGYNRDRGPADVAGFRVHVEY